MRRPSNGREEFKCTQAGSIIDHGRNETPGMGQTHRQLRHPGSAGDLGPGLEGLGSSGSILVSWKAIAVEMKEVVDARMGGEKALCLPG